MYLERTESTILAVHVDYRVNDESARANRENEAIMKLLPELQKIREFEFIKSDLTTYAGSDVMNIGCQAISIAHQHNCKEIVIGFVSDIRHEQIEYVTKKLGILNSIAKQLKKGHGKHWKFTPLFVLPRFYDTKRNYIEVLGNLVSLTWFCRKPQLAKETNGCGICHACKHVLRSVDQIEIVKDEY